MAGHGVIARNFHAKNAFVEWVGFRLEYVRAKNIPDRAAIIINVFGG